MCADAQRRPGGETSEDGPASGKTLGDSCAELGGAHAGAGCAAQSAPASRPPDDGAPGPPSLLRMSAWRAAREMASTVGWSWAFGLFLPLLTWCTAVWSVKHMTMRPSFVEARYEDGAALTAAVSGSHVRQLPPSEIHAAIAPYGVGFFMTPLWWPVTFCTFAGWPRTLRHAVLAIALQILASAAFVFMCYWDHVLQVMGSEPYFLPDPAIWDILVPVLTFAMHLWSPWLYQRWYAVKNCLKAAAWRVLQTFGLYIVFIFFYRPLYGTLPTVWAIVSRLGINAVRELLVGANVVLALKVRRPDGTAPVPLYQLSWYVTTPIYLVALYTRAAQLTNTNILQTLVLEILTTAIEMRRYLSLLQGQIPGHKLMEAAGMWVWCRRRPPARPNTVQPVRVVEHGPRSAASLAPSSVAQPAEIDGCMGTGGDGCMATGGKEPSTQHCVKEEPAITLASVYLAGDLGAGGREWKGVHV